MKKTIMTLALSSVLVALPTQADTLLGLYVGAQAWNMETEGGFANESALTNFNFEDETKSSFYVALEHPIPFVPNIKIRRTGMDTAGEIMLTSSFTFGDQIFTADSNLMTDVELTTTDFILYYEFFDNDLVSFDFGINGKHIDGTLFVQDVSDASISANEEFSGVVPMAYSRLAFGLPFTGWGVYAEGSYLAIDDHTISDFQAAITYSLLDNIAVDMTFELGYRAVTVQLEDLDDIYSNLDFKGVYAGLEVHF